MTARSENSRTIATQRTLLLPVACEVLQQLVLDVVSGAVLQRWGGFVMLTLLKRAGSVSLLSFLEG